MKLHGNTRLVSEKRTTRASSTFSYNHWSRFQKLRFRGGVSTYAAGIKSAPWNKDFAAEADELFIQKVKPGILEVEDLVESGSSPISHILNSSKKEEA